MSRRVADPRPKATPSFIAYYRVSTKNQGKSGLGLEAQHEAVRAFLSHNYKDDGEVIAAYQEIESGKLNYRPQMELALAHAKREKATLIVAKLDRLSRNVYFIASLIEAKIKFICCDMPEADKTWLQMNAVFAERERDAISERTTKALAVVRRRIKRDGKVVSSKGNTITRLGSPTPMKGSKAGSKVRKRQADDFARNILPMIADLQKRGITTLRALAEELNDRGIKTMTDANWHATTVANLLKRNV